MPTDNPLADPARRQQLEAWCKPGCRVEVSDKHACELAGALWEALRYIETVEANLAECYRLTGADPDGNEDWRLAREAVAEVRRLRDESDAAETQQGAGKYAVRLLERLAVVSPKDAEELADLLERAPHYAICEAQWARGIAQRLQTLEGAIRAQDEREARAGERCAVSRDEHGCDWPDAVAEALLVARQRIETLEQERDELRDRFQRAIDGGFDLRQRAERAEALVREAFEEGISAVRGLAYLYPETSDVKQRLWQASAVKRRLEGGERGLTTDGKVI